MTHRVITMLFKKGDKADVKNWRLISLLNISYKILAKTLARRLAGHLPDLVQGDQGAFVQGRSIFNNIVTAIEVLEVVQSENVDVAVLLLDLEKAYDKVGWTFVLTTLRHMGFGPGFCKWTIAMYTCATASVAVNGHLSLPFRLTRSLRQGCPLAPLRFVLQMEVLLNRIRRHPDIRGLQLRENSACTVKALTDDLFTVCENSVSTLYALKEAMAEYSALSEASVNWSKSTYLLPKEFSLKVEWGMRRVEEAPELARLLHTGWITNQGVPEDIVSDRDTRFMSAFWTSLMTESGTTMKSSSARHPQTDGQTERAHQTAQMMLRTLIRPDQKDRVDRLPDIEFAYNTSVHPAICVTPFELHHGGEKARIFADLLLPQAADIDVPCSPASVRKYRDLLIKARVNMQKAQVRMQQQANRRRLPCPFREGDLVWVLSEEFALEQDVSRKLLPKWFTSAVGDDPAGPSFVINIPPHLTVHRVFHASKLAIYMPPPADEFPGRRSQLDCPRTCTWGRYHG
ncbi:hypothetical protein CBR_g88563 [Chara braunii]|uniref:Integrase catalytic domain-containing protein n=1 Tax=Chara braunii TaxID=69332 RepID=A0A388KB34_CHABU|nr:hypothetical protein CBR_g88563 [Chara braunii]|eukprot:GBG67274.1 hypothetical protein CBR_g88563 [Chara braunii]